MRIGKKSEKLEKVTPRMTPMIDVVFLLLIFFMCVSEMSKLEVENVTLPEALSASPVKPGPRMTVNVMPDGGYRVEGRELSPTALRRLIAGRAVMLRAPNGSSELAVRIRADAYVPYRYVQRVLAECSRHKVWMISFGVAPRRDA